MKRLNEIKKEINKQGIKRIKYNPDAKFEVARKYFCEIANELLSIKNETFDYKSVRNLVDFMINWSYMKTDDIDFQKGFIIKGKTGRGKTLLFKAWQYFLKIDNIKYIWNENTRPLEPVIANVKKISGEYQHPETGGYGIIQAYSFMNCLVLDDIGKEQEESKNYGNNVNVVEEIINNREENNLLTFATTNLERFSTLYDDRTVSRMNRLFTPIATQHNIDFRINPNKMMNDENKCCCCEYISMIVEKEGILPTCNKNKIKFKSQFKIQYNTDQLKNNTCELYKYYK